MHYFLRTLSSQMLRRCTQATIFSANSFERSLSCLVQKHEKAFQNSRFIRRKSGNNEADQNMLQATLMDSDPELAEFIMKEKKRQNDAIEMIASENFTSMAVLECLGSCLTNKYSEGLPGHRYYGGNEYIDEIEKLAQKRGLDLYKLDEKKWGINVQPYSGSPANLAVYTGVLRVHDRIMGLDLPDGGHLSHGFFTAKKKVSATSIFFESMPYKVNPETGLIDYDKLAEKAKTFRPQIIIAGTSCYSRLLDYKRFREICDDCGAYLMSDMAHVAGLVAAELIPSPFEYSDIVTTTTHKTLRGPRAGVIFFRKGERQMKKEQKEKVMYDLEDRINGAVFPALQGGPHNNAIAGIATAFKQAKTPEFKAYQEQVIKNAKALAQGLMDKGYKVATGGTDVHLVLVDVRSLNLTGAEAEHILEGVGITCNKNTVPGDTSAANASGIRLGTPALTTRGFVEEDMETIVNYIDEALKIGADATKLPQNTPKMTPMAKTLKENPEANKKIKDLHESVIKFSTNFPMPGHKCF